MSLNRIALTAALLFALSATAQEWAKPALEHSPRHHEYVPIKHDGRTVNTLVVYPEVSRKAPTVILIHEIFGLSDWAKQMADELAAQGYIVLAPDLLSGAGPNGGNSESFSSTDATVKAVSGLDSAQVTADLDAVADYSKTIAAANGKLAVGGFCWGGGKTFAFATHRHDLSAAFVFYGPPPPSADLAAISTPVYGFYAGNDARIGATVPGTVDAMKAAGKTYEPVTYEGAGHGFMRAGEDPGNTVPANRKARDEAFARLLSLLKPLNGSASHLHPGPPARKARATGRKAAGVSVPSGACDHTAAGF